LLAALDRQLTAGDAMTPHAWLTLVACAGQLGLALLSILRGARSPLALPLALLCLCFFSWNMAWLAYLVSGHAGWRYIDVATSPMSLPLALHFVVVFVGKRRQLRAVLWTAYGVMGAISVASLSAFVSARAAAFAGSATWAALVLTAAVAGIGFALRLLLSHLRKATDPEEQMRTRLVFAALGLGALLATSELIADLGYPVPRGGALGALAGAGVLSIVVFRFRLLESELSSRTGVYAWSIAALSVVAYLAVFYYFAAHTAMLVLGTITITFVLLVGVRRLTSAVAGQRQRMEELVVLGRFSVQMAHDMKNPLAALKGAVQYLTEERARGRTAELDEFLQLLAEQIERMSAVIDKYQRLGRVEPALETVELNELVRRVVALQEFAAPERVRTELDLAQNLPSTQADPDLIAGALDNLVRNAVEAMPDGGVLTLRTRLAQPGNGAGHIAVSVGDTGRGMDARVQELAFDDFYTTKVTGSGLGLAFVRRVAQAHGGEVRLSSGVGQGTVACVELPVRAGQAA
jgi:signal transduction histidine kinase